MAHICLFCYCTVDTVLVVGSNTGQHTGNN